MSRRSWIAVVTISFSVLINGASLCQAGELFHFHKRAKSTEATPHTERQAGPDRLATASVDFPLHPPRTAEALVYRSIFADLFRHPSAAACAPGGKAAGNATEAAALWLGVDASSDPSGRAVARIHASASAI